MFNKYDDTDKDLTKRSTKSIYKSLSGSQPGSIVYQKAHSELEYRKERNANHWKMVVAVLTILGILVGIANYFKH